MTRSGPPAASSSFRCPSGPCRCRCRESQIRTVSTRKRGDGIKTGSTVECEPSWTRDQRVPRPDPAMCRTGASAACQLISVMIVVAITGYVQFAPRRRQTAAAAVGREPTYGQAGPTRGGWGRCARRPSHRSWPETPEARWPPRAARARQGGCRRRGGCARRDQPRSRAGRRPCRRVGPQAGAGDRSGRPRRVAGQEAGLPRARPLDCGSPRLRRAAASSAASAKSSKKR